MRRLPPSSSTNSLPSLRAMPLTMKYRSRDGAAGQLVQEVRDIFMRRLFDFNVLPCRAYAQGHAM